MPRRTRGHCRKSVQYNTVPVDMNGLPNRSSKAADIETGSAAVPPALRCQMISQLTQIERQRAILLSLAVAICGLLMAIAGHDDPIGLHGALICLAGILMIFRIGKDYYAPAPSDDRSARYYDDPAKVGIVLAMAWVVFGLAIGDWVAWQLVQPDLTFGAWSSFGRIRPVHTTSVIFGFGGNALIATSFYVMQRTSRARIPDQVAPWFVVWGY